MRQNERNWNDPGGERARTTIVLGLVMLVQMFCSIGLMAIALISPMVSRDLGVSASLVGLQVGWSFLWAIIAAPMAGAVVRRYGAGRSSQLALGLSGLACMVCAVGVLPSVIAGSALAGAAYSLVNPASSQILNALAPSRARHLIFAAKQSAVPIGWAVGGLTLPVLALALGWQAALLLLGAVMAVAALALRPGHRVWSDERDPLYPLVSLSGYFQLGFADRRLQLLAFGGMLYASAQIIGLSFLVTALVEEAGWTAIAAGGAVTVMQVAGATGRVLLAIVADRVRSGMGTAVAAGALTALALLFTGFCMITSTAWALLLATAALGFFSMPWNSLLMSEAAGVARPTDVGLVTARLMIYYSGGSLLGPLVFTALFALTDSYGLTYIFFALPAVIGAVCVAGAMRESDRGSRDQRPAMPYPD